MVTPVSVIALRGMEIEVGDAAASAVQRLGAVRGVAVDGAAGDRERGRTAGAAVADQDATAGDGRDVAQDARVVAQGHGAALNGRGRRRRWRWCSVEAPRRRAAASAPACRGQAVEAAARSLLEFEAMVVFTKVALGAKNSATPPPLAAARVGADGAADRGERAQAD